MARATFGGGIADFVTQSIGGGIVKFAPATLSFYSAKTGGTRYSDLLLGGSAASTISVGSDGQVPQFQGPDGVFTMWADGGGARVQMVAVADAVALATAPVDASVATVVNNPASATSTALATTIATKTVNLRRGRNVLDYGADPTGATDSTTAFQNAYNAANGGSVYIPAGDYKLAGQVSGSKPLHLYGDGARASVIHRPAGSTSGGAFKITGTRGTAVTVTADVVAGTLTITLNSTTGIAAGDWLMIRSDKAWPGTTTSAKYGEIVRVTSVAGSVVTIKEPAEESYLLVDNPVAHRLDMVPGSSVRGLTLVNDAPTTKPSDYGFYIEYASNVFTEDVTFSRLDGAAWELPNVVGFQATRQLFDRLSDLDASGLYGYGIDMRDSSRDFVVSDCLMSGGRHLFTTNAYGVTNPQGIPRKATVSNCTAVGVTNAGFDTHPEGTKVRFFNCTVRGGQGFGFHFRATDMEVVNGLVDGSVGPGVWVRPMAARAIVDVEVRNTHTGVVDGVSREGRGIWIEGGVSEVRIRRAIIKDTDEDGLYVGDGATFKADLIDITNPGRVTQPNAIRHGSGGHARGNIIENLSITSATNGIFGTSASFLEVRNLRAYSVTNKYAGGLIIAGPKVGAKTSLYYAADASSFTAAAQTQSRLKLGPLLVDRRITIDRLGVEITTLAAGSTVRLGVYLDDGNGYPGSLLLDAGTVSGAAVGFVEVTTSLTLDPGLYWIGGCSQGGDPAVRVNTGNSRLVGVNAGATIGGVAYYADAVTGALPATFTTTVSSSQSAHRVLARLA